MTFGGRIQHSDLENWLSNWVRTQALQRTIYNVCLLSRMELKECFCHVAKAVSDLSDSPHVFAWTKDIYFKGFLEQFFW